MVVRKGFHLQVGRVLLGCGLLVFAVEGSFAEEGASAKLTFEKDVRPILKANCFQCHGEEEELEGGLDLRFRRLMVKGGKHGEAIVPGEASKSRLVERVREQEMPPGEVKLTAAEVETIARWIDQGAATARPEPEQIGGGLVVTEEERSHWSFQPIVRPDVPKVKGTDRVQSAIDAFLLSRLEREGLSFSEPADKRTLIRRVYFDLIGLPPSPEEADGFIADDSPGAYAALVDRLLASPEYGERWGRHWLDVAGYADSEGYTDTDLARKYAYKYRDYVIRSFNADKPFDQFIVEQLAGDELAPHPPKDLSPENLEKVVATGFLRMAPDGTGSGGADPAVARNAVVAETINIVSTSLLGMTVGCAQCHHHRYDPISQDDYYRMRAIFEPVYDVKAWRAPSKRLVSLFTEADRAKAKAIEDQAKRIDARRTARQAEYIRATFEKEIVKVPEILQLEVRRAFETPAKERDASQQALMKAYPSTNVTASSLYLYDRQAADALKKIADEAAKVRATKPVEDFIRVATEVAGNVPETHLFYRGDISQPRAKMAPGGLSILTSLSLPKVAENDASLPTTGRRLAFAKRLTSGQHPLTARVLMNRVWMHHFGRGIVDSPGDFGVLGDRPSHPELLDWLADEFVAGGWHLKRIHRLLMISSAYRQSSQRSPALNEIDPENLLLGRMSIRRMEAEVVRDSILAVSGKLNPNAFGEPVPVMRDLVGQVVVGVDTTDSAGRPTGKVIALHGEEFRRSVYVQVRRSEPLGVMETFDAPIMEPNCESRNASTVAPQALMLMNSDFSVRQSEFFAQRVAREAGSDPAARIERAWRLAFGRSPSEAESSSAAVYLTDQVKHFAEDAAKPAAGDKKDAKKEATESAEPAPDMMALATLCQALISSNGFLYID